MVATDIPGKILRFPTVFPVVFHKPWKCLTLCNLSTSKLPFWCYLLHITNVQKFLSVHVSWLSIPVSCSSFPSSADSDRTLLKGPEVYMVQDASFCTGPDPPGCTCTLQPRTRASLFCPLPPTGPQHNSCWWPGSAWAGSQEVAAENLAYGLATPVRLSY